MDGVFIRKFCGNDRISFIPMFYQYFKDDFGIEITEEQAVDICNNIIKQTNQGIMLLAMLTVGGEIHGFANYQIDTPASDWCEQEGCGFIREIYISKEKRNHGYGRKLAEEIENDLYQLGAAKIYLTAEEDNEFWVKCGYRDTGRLSKINHLNIYEKL